MQDINQVPHRVYSGFSTMISGFSGSRFGFFGPFSGFFSQIFGTFQGPSTSNGIHTPHMMPLFSCFNAQRVAQKDLGNNSDNPSPTLTGWYDIRSFWNSSRLDICPNMTNSRSFWATLDIFEIEKWSFSGFCLGKTRPFQGFQGFQGQVLHIQGFQGFQGFQGPVYTLFKV